MSWTSRCAAIALGICAALVCAMPMRAPAAQTLDKEALKRIPTSVTDEELVAAFVAEPTYRWKRTVRVYIDFGVWVNPEFADCIVDNLRRGLASTSDVLAFEFPRHRVDANFVLSFQRRLTDEACGEPEEGKFVITNPPLAFSCVAMWVRSGEITYAEAHIPLAALRHTFDLYQATEGACPVDYAKYSVLYGTGYFSPRRFAGFPPSLIDWRFADLDALFFQMLYRVLPGPEPDPAKVREVIGRAVREGRQP